MKREEFIKEVGNALSNPIAGQNRMGCLEAWYDPYYAIGKSFSLEELKAMSEKELNNLYRLANQLSEAFY